MKEVNGMHWVGIDIAKGSMEVFVDPGARRFAVENTDEGVAQLVRSCLLSRLYTSFLKPPEGAKLRYLKRSIERT